MSVTDQANLFEEKLIRYEKDAKIHGLLMGLSFLVIIPAGTLIARYMRTFTNRWFHAHWIINGLLALPLIIGGAYMATRARKLLLEPLSPHGKRGFLLIGLYIGQLVLGVIIHYIPIQFRIFGHRPPQNYIHALLGLSVLALANYQFNDGINNEADHWAPDILQSVKRAWLALIIIFWSLYVIGLFFLRHQFKQEREAIDRKGQESFTLRAHSTP